MNALWMDYKAAVEALGLPNVLALDRAAEIFEEFLGNNKFEASHHLGSS